MARLERRLETPIVRQPSTGHGTASRTQGDATAEAEDPAQPRQWTLDRIEKIIGSIA